MISDYRCIYCLMRSYGNRLEKSDMPIEAKEEFTRNIIKTLNENWYGISAPECARNIQEMYRSFMNDPDPYKEVKKISNDIALQMYPDLEKIVKSSPDPYRTALKLAIAGNIIDFAVHDNYDLPGTIDKVLKSDFSVDHSGRLYDELRRAEKVLYLGDNSGEIVLDKLLINQINHPRLTYVVRGGPAINDVTMEDAEYTGMTAITKVISTGYDAPTIIISKSGDEFRKHYDEADLIISKGQGNLEGLIGNGDDRIYFLLMVKCDVIAEYMNVEKNSYVVYNPKLAKGSD